jgi:hypothetical protein
MADVRTRNQRGPIRADFSPEISSRAPALIYAKAGDDCGGVLIEEQLEMVWRVAVDPTDPNKVITSAIQGL